MSFGLIPLIILMLVDLSLWIFSLIHMGKKDRWGWFIFTILFHVWLFYWFVLLIMPKNNKRKRKK